MARPRSRGGRERNGRLKRTTSAEERLDRVALAARMGHRRSIPLADILDPRAECLLGRMNLSGLLSGEQYEAGRRYGAIVHAFRATIEGPSAGSGWIDKVGGRSVMSDEDAARLRRSYDAAFCVLTQVGRKSLLAVHAAVFDEDASVHPLYLKSGLDALATHFGL